MPDSLTMDERARLDWYDALWADPVMQILGEIQAECQRQELAYGADNAAALDGTGPDVQWLQPLTPAPANVVEAMLRRDYESKTGRITWMDLVREEIAEAFQETDEEPLTEELTQAASLIVNWIKAKRARACS